MAIFEVTMRTAVQVVAKNQAEARAIVATTALPAILVTTAKRNEWEPVDRGIVVKKVAP